MASFAAKMQTRTAARAATACRRSAVVVKATSRVNQSKSDIIVSPSILSADFSRLGDEVRQGQTRGAWPPGVPRQSCLNVGRLKLRTDQGHRLCRLRLGAR